MNFYEKFWWYQTLKRHRIKISKLNDGQYWVEYPDEAPEAMTLAEVKKLAQSLLHKPYRLADDVSYHETEKWFRR